MRLAYSLAFALILTAPLDAQIVFGPPLESPVIDNSALKMVGDVGDLNGDGLADAVVGAGHPNNSFQRIFNNGDGTFTPPEVFWAQTADVARLADFDADGNLDVVIANGRFLLRMGEGGGDFGREQYVFDLSGNSFSLEVAEVTGDAHLDIIGMHGGPILGAHAINVLPGNGDGTFGLSMLVEFTGGFQPLRADVGDVNNDTIPDLIVTASSLVDGHARLYLGTGGGGFVGAGTFGMGQGPQDARLVDLDDDGNLDMILAGSPGLGVKLGAGDGTFSATTLYLTDVVNARLGIGDYNDDGEEDVAANLGSILETAILLGNGNGGLVDTLRVTGMSIADDLKAVDLDGDGRTDLGRVQVAKFQTLINHTYDTGDPWLDVGFPLADPGGGLDDQPIMWAQGDLTGGTQAGVTIDRNGVDTTVAYLVLGVSAIFAPFDGGGIWVPNPDILAGPFVINDQLEISGTVPASVPAGIQFWLQTWFIPGPGQAYAATSAIEATTP